MATLIDKLKVADATNIATIGFETLVLLIANGASGAANYTGTAAEAATLKAGITVTTGASSTGVGAAAIDAEYIKVRTQAGTKNAFVEVILTEAYVSAITLPANITAVARLLTNPANSQVQSEKARKHD